MMNGNNNMDNKLHRLENQSLPDLSKQDEHWQEMKKMLQPFAMPPQKVSKIRSWHWVAAACFIAGICFLIIKQKNDIQEPKKEIVISKDTAGTDIKKIAPTTDQATTIVKYIAAPKFNLKNTKSKPSQRNKGNMITVNVDGMLPLTFPDTVVVSKPDPESSKATLAGFFSQLEEKEQEFTVDPSRDTVINGAKGTALMIPANTFNAKTPVTILLKEYYSYEDIITNKLTTTSNSEQLVTGGMIHITAMADGKEVNMNPNRAIRWFIPDTTESLDQMSLFVAQSRSATREKGNMDFAVMNEDTSTLETLNWVPSKEYFTRTYLVKKVKALDLSDEPFKSKEKKKGLVGKFRIADDSKITSRELQAMLQEKYTYYKVKVKTRRNYHSFFYIGNSSRNYEFSNNSLGDSAWFSLETAEKYRFNITDSITYVQTSVVYKDGNYVKKTFSNINLDELSKRFSVDIRTLGWINCDRFYKDNREKMDYYITLNDSAVNYYTVLVFDKFKSMVKGINSGKSVLFSGVPKGEKARVICIGVQDGKTVAAIEPLTATKTRISDMKFEETNPTAFRQQASEMDK